MSGELDLFSAGLDPFEVPPPQETLAPTQQSKRQDMLIQRQRAYQLAWPMMQIMLRDLMTFCRLMEEENEEATPDVNRLLILTGRRQVWLRIERHLKLSTEDLFALYAGAAIQPREGEDNAA